MGGTNEEPQHNGWNISEAETQRYLALVQEDTVQTLIPTITFLILVALVGAVGNSLVLLVYYRGFQNSATRVLILYVAAVDLFSCLFVIPGDVYDIFNMWNWRNFDLCRFRIFMTITSTIVSATALLMLAVVRYRKVCNSQGWQVSCHHAKVSAIVILLITILVSAPITVIYGDRTNPIPDVYTRDAQLELIRTTAEKDDQSKTSDDFLSLESNSTEISQFIATPSLQDTEITIQTVTEISPPPRTTAVTRMTTVAMKKPMSRLILFGHECTISDVYIDTIWPMVTTAILFITFLSLAVSVCILYCLLGRKAWKHRRPVQIQRLAGGDQTKVNNSDGLKMKMFRSFGFNRGKRSLKPAAKTDLAFSNISHTPTVTTTKNSSLSGQDSDSSQSVLLCSSANLTEMLSSTTDINASKPALNITKAELIVLKHHDNASINISEEDHDRKKHSETKEDGVLRSSILETSSTFDKEVGKPREKWQSSSLALACKDHHSSSDSENGNLDTPSANISTSAKILQLSPAHSHSKNVNTKKQLKQQRKNTSSNEFVEIELQSKPHVRVIVSDDQRDPDRVPERISAAGDGSESFPQDLTCPNPYKKSENEKNARNTRDAHKPSMLLRKIQIDKTKRLDRTTVMLFVISMVYIVGYFSYFSMMFFKVFAPEAFNSLGLKEKSVWHFFIRLFYINCASNHIVYSFCNPNFRKTLTNLFRKRK